MPHRTSENSFRQWPFKTEILDAISGMGFTTPTEIQRQAIPLALQGEDVVGQAKTGTGKTAAFGLPILQNLKLGEKFVQALVLAPTRELAEQVGQELTKMGRNLGARVTMIYGGTDFDRQIRELRHGAHIVVGTPGRIMDLVRRGSLSLSKIHFLVLDEADRMLDMGFIEDIEWILKHCPPRQSRQTMFFSATIPEGVRSLTRNFMRNAQFVKGAVSSQMTVESVRQEYYNVGRRNKLWALTRILEHEERGLMLVFCATKRMVDRLVEDLQHVGFPAEALHGDMSQNRRTRVMEKFRNSRISLLVATDVAARGLDIDGITHVINYDLPEEPEVYVHRVGRTGRMGKAGKAISFVSRDDRRQLELVQTVAGGLIELKEPPEPPAGERHAEKVRKVIDWDHISDRYGNVHFRIEVGRNDGATITQLHKLIRGAAGLRDYMIGPIKVHEDHSMFTLPKDCAMRTLQALRSTAWNGHRFGAEIIPQQ